jgi:hypothetical protein
MRGGEQHPIRQISAFVGSARALFAQLDLARSAYSILPPSEGSCASLLL